MRFDSMSVQWVSFVLALTAWSAFGKVSHWHITTDDRDYFLVEPAFGFDNNGRVQLHVSNIKSTTTQKLSSIHKNCFGFFLARAASLEAIELDRVNQKCYLVDKQFIRALDFSKWDAQKSTPLEVEIKFSDRHGIDQGEYALYYAACDPGIGFSFDIRISFANLDANGRPDYLSVGERPLPMIYFVPNHKF